MQIVPVKTRKELNEFIKLPFQLYKDDPYWVAPLLMEQKKFFNPKKNPYFKHSEAQLFLAYQDDNAVYFTAGFHGYADIGAVSPTL